MGSSCDYVVTAMHVRISRNIRNGRTYEYAQLVASYRRASDGMPTSRVIGTLGALSPLELDNLRAALAASRDGRRVVVAPLARGSAARRPEIVANLRYLDISVALELWREWQLPELLDGLMPIGDADVSAAKVVAALVIQRLVDPGSKLAATAWFPRSALPELLDVPPSRFNNTRIHRVLDLLDLVGPELQAKLPRRFEEKDGVFTSLFIDVTDAAFVGHGPSYAARAKTKEGFVARKIGIVLLCNQRGYPLRWEVVSGSAHDSKTMLGMLESVAELRWVGNAPVVCDRAMGKTATIVEMSRLGLRFVTALTTTEFPSYGGERLPYQALAKLKPSSACDAKVEQEAAGLVVAAGMTKADDNLFVMDLGIIERTLTEPVPQAANGVVAAQAMKLCRRMLQLVDSEESPSFEDARRKVGLGKSVAAKYRGLQKLVEDVQREVLAGRADGCALDELLTLARLEPDEQRRQFAELLAAPRRRKPPARVPAAAPSPSPSPSAALKVRIVAYFNQERFVDKRHRANAELDEIRSFITDLNDRLMRARASRSRRSIEAEVDRKLRAFNLLDVCKTCLHEDQLAGRTRFRVELTIDTQEWDRRRRFDGFTLLVSHAELPHDAAELCRLYRAKDIVEKDFHVIKGVVEVRPMWHHSDAKVRAHVTLCMLALLLERTLGHRLRGKYSAEAALEELEPCRLNQFSAGEQTVYGLTRPTAEQKTILRQLGLAKLGDDEEVSERLRPR